jgi:4-hydroxy-3-methylbut-2-enyl diphosphate reductase
VALSAGASAPEVLVDALLAALRERYEVEVREVRTAEESVTFRMPPLPVARATC